MIAKIQSYLHPRSWTWSRLARLLMGLVTVGAGIDSGVQLMTFAGIALTISALLRIGCADNCDISQQSKS